jgi:hypothetical protein
MNDHAEDTRDSAENREGTFEIEEIRLEALPDYPLLMQTEYDQ